WSQQILNTNHSLERIIPNSETDFDSLLSFPNLFNITYVDVKKTVPCQKSNSIACHKRMVQNGKSQCSFNLCHTTNSTRMIEVIFKYEETNNLVTMLVMCHLLTTDEKKRYQTDGVAEEEICHFVTPQTSYFICIKN
ncbi:unnamed protein product, partial [Didymodactylos carnosus]